jgi:hypothetical protein
MLLFAAFRKFPRLSGGLFLALLGAGPTLAAAAAPDALPHTAQEYRAPVNAEVLRAQPTAATPTAGAEKAARSAAPLALQPAPPQVNGTQAGLPPAASPPQTDRAPTDLPQADLPPNAPQQTGQRPADPSQTDWPQTDWPQTDWTEEDAQTQGTADLQGSNFSDQGQVRQWRDPQSGDSITSVTPPHQPQQQNPNFLFIAPQIYPQMPYGPDGQRPQPLPPGWNAPGHSGRPGGPGHNGPNRHRVPGHGAGPQGGGFYGHDAQGFVPHARPGDPSSSRPQGGPGHKGAGQDSGYRDFGADRPGGNSGAAHGGYNGPSQHEDRRPWSSTRHRPPPQGSLRQ